eukprot:17214-Heterococcus_DN1.PRE.4
MLAAAASRLCAALALVLIAVEAAAETSLRKSSQCTRPAAACPSLSKDVAHLGAAAGDASVVLTCNHLSSVSPLRQCSAHDCAVLRLSKACQYCGP